MGRSLPRNTNDLRNSRPSETSAMTEQADSPENVATVAPSSESRRRRTSIVRTVVLLVAATAVLFAFILGLNDARRRQMAMELAQWHAGTLRSRLSDSGLLPLNLDPAPAAERTSTMFHIVGLTRDQARALRKASVPVIAGHTPVIPRHLASHGRAVVLFESGAFRVEWLATSEFDDLYAEQLETIRRLKANGSPGPSGD